MLLVAVGTSATAAVLAVKRDAHNMHRLQNTAIVCDNDDITDNNTKYINNNNNTMTPTTLPASIVYTAPPTIIY